MTAAVRMTWQQAICRKDFSWWLNSVLWLLFGVTVLCTLATVWCDCTPYSGYCLVWLHSVFWLLFGVTVVCTLATVWYDCTVYSGYCLVWLYCVLWLLFGVTVLCTRQSSSVTLATIWCDCTLYETVYVSHTSYGYNTLQTFYVHIDSWLECHWQKYNDVHSAVRKWSK